MPVKSSGSSNSTGNMCFSASDLREVKSSSSILSSSSRVSRFLFLGGANNDRCILLLFLSGRAHDWPTTNRKCFHGSVICLRSWSQPNTASHVSRIYLAWAGQRWACPGVGQTMAIKAQDVISSVLVHAPIKSFRTSCRIQPLCFAHSDLMALIRGLKESVKTIYSFQKVWYTRSCQSFPIGVAAECFLAAPTCYRLAYPLHSYTLRQQTGPVRLWTPPSCGTS